MEDQHLESDLRPRWSEAMTRSLEQQRGQVRSLVGNHLERLDSLEAEISAQVQRVLTELSRTSQQTAADREQAEQSLQLREQDLARLEAELQQAKQDLLQEHESQVQHFDANRAELLAWQAKLELRQAELEAGAVNLSTEQQQAFQRAQEQAAKLHEAEQYQARFETATRHCEEIQAELDQARQHVARLESRLQAADDARGDEARAQEQQQAQLAALTAQIDALRAELDSARADQQTTAATITQLEAAAAESEQVPALQAQLAETISQRDELASQLTAALDKACEAETANHELVEELAASRAELQQSDRTEQLADLEQRLQTLATERDEYATRLAESEALWESSTPDESGRVAELEHEKDCLEMRVHKLEQQLMNAPSAAADPELARRYEMAMDDVRELKKKNSELEKKVASGKSTPADSGANDGMDWEAQKRRMLAALEADEDDPNDTPERKQERLKIEEAIRATDTALAEKEDEIAELRQLLEEQSGNQGSVAVGAAMFGDLLDKDEFVQQERERLKELQAELQDKLRQAEVELSLQRAKIARDRMEIDARHREMEEKIAKHGPMDSQGNHAKAAEPPPRGRWLSRLGLKDDPNK